MILKRHRPVIIDGVEYESMVAAQKDHGLKYQASVRGRILSKNPKFAGWRYK